MKKTILLAALILSGCIETRVERCDKGACALQFVVSGDLDKCREVVARIPDDKLVCRFAQ